MAYKYNPNDQRFYDQLAEMSNIDRRSTDQSQKANALKLQNERYILEKIAQLPDDYQKGFKNKRERTPLVYGEDVQDIPEGTPEGDNAFYNLDPEAELNISATPPKDAVIQAEADPRFGNPRVDMNPNAGRMYSPGAAAVLDGDAVPGFNPPMANPPARPAPGYWMNETPYPTSSTNRQPVPVPFPPFPLTEEELAALEFEKKKEPTPPVEVAANPPMPAEEAIRPKAELKKNQDPRVSFRRFKANEFLQNNAVFQMDLPRIQPTYATMLGAETALAKSGVGKGNQKEWEVLKDLETEEGQAPMFNAYTGESRPSGLKRKDKPSAASGYKKLAEGENGILVQKPDGSLETIPFKPKQGARFPILVEDGKGGSTLVYPDNQFVPGPPTKVAPPTKADKPETFTKTVRKNGKDIEVLFDKATGNEIKDLGDAPVKPSASRDKLGQMQQDALVDIESQKAEMDRFEKQYNEFIKKNPTFSKGFNPATPGFAVSLGKAVNADLESLEQTMSKINLEALVKNMRGLSKNFDTAKEASALEAIKFKIARGEPTTRQMIDQVRTALTSAQKKLSKKAVKDLTDSEVDGVSAPTDDAAAKRARLEELRKKKAAQGGN